MFLVSFKLYRDESPPSLLSVASAGMGNSYSVHLYIGNLAEPILHSKIPLSSGLMIIYSVDTGFFIDLCQIFFLLLSKI